VSAAQALDIVQVIRGEVEQAADMMLSAAEKGLRDLTAARAGEAGALDSIERTLCAILEACAFQDLTGQRLTKLSAALNGLDVQVTDGDPLLAGPANPGQGLDQDAADRLMRGAGG